MSVRLTVIGSAGTHSTAQRVCSSYLLSHGDTHVLFDLGPGALHNLMKVIDVADLDAVVISHTHPDHFGDLFGLNYAFRFHPAAPGPVTIHGPADLEDKLTGVLPEESMEKMRDYLPLAPAAAGDRIEVGDVVIELFAMNHPVQTLGSRITAGGRTIAFTGDTAPTPEIDRLAADADLLVCDATWTEDQRPLPPDIHCTGAEAGAAAASAGARRLLITHVGPYNDPQDVAAEAATRYDGEILIAVDLQEIIL